MKIFAFTLYTIVVVFCLLIPPLAHAQTSALLLEKVDPISLAKITGSSDIQHFTINKEVLANIAGKQLTSLLLPVADNDILFQASKIIVHENGITTWIGQDSRLDNNIVITFGEDHFYARVVSQGKVIIYSPDGTKLGIVSQLLDPSLETPLANDARKDPGKKQSGSDPDQDVHLPVAEASEADDGSMIDIMIYYTTGWAAKHSGTVATKIQSLLDISNTAFDNSKISTQFRLVYSVKVSYPDDSPGGTSEALDDLTDNVGVFSDAEALRDQYGVDQVTLLRDYVDEGCGIAWVMNDDTTARKAYAVVHEGVQSTGWFCSTMTLVHEIGHNLGCAHDHANASVPGIYSDSYGYQFAPYYTVMSYANGCSGCSRVSYFSNPAVFYNGNVTGVTDYANNARTINVTRVKMAGYRQSKVTPPSPSPRDSSLIPAVTFLLGGQD